MKNLTNNPVEVLLIPKWGNVEAVLAAQGNKMKPWEEGDGDVGFIQGTAVRFIPWSMKDTETDELLPKDNIERIAIGGAFPHDYIRRNCEYGEGMLFGATDDKDTQYGYFTTTGFFVDRIKGGEIWFTMLKLSGWMDASFERPMNLNSYHLKPEVIEHCAALIDTPYEQAQA